MSAGNEPGLPLYGHGEAQARFLSAHERGRLHHGWLLQGPSGIGKARLAMRIAAFLLGARGPQSAPLDAPAGDRVLQKVLSSGHPDLRWIDRRAGEDGKVAQDIPVETVRALPAFLSLRPALGGWRVGVIDSLDELNAFGSNAILKTLEEPPARCCLILISHGRKPVLPTIRSRCRRLSLKPLGEADTRAVLAREAPDIADDAVQLMPGRPGEGIALTSAKGGAGAKAARRLIEAGARPDASVLSEAVTAAGSDPTAFDAFVKVVLDWLEARAGVRPEAAETWLGTARLAADVVNGNLDRGQAVASLVPRLLAEAKTR